jgi:GWxTD domain-containing protein
MRKKMKKLFLTCLILSIALQGNIFGQAKYREYMDMKQQAGFRVETVISPLNVDSAEVTFLFGISPDILSYKKTEDVDSGKTVAFPNVEVEIKDNSGIIRDRIQFEKEVFSTVNHETTDKMITGVVTTVLKKGDYKSKVTLRDKTKFIERKDLIFSASGESDLLSPSFIVTKLENNRLIPCIFEGNIPFQPEQIKLYIYAKNFENVSYEITSPESEDNPYRSEEFSYIGKVSSTGMNSFIFHENEEELTCKLENKATKSEYFIYEIKFPEESILPADYSIAFYPDGKDSIAFDFSVIWNNKPHSLFNPDYAAELMFYILDDAKFDELNSGDEAEKMQNIIEYWKNQDHDESTPFLESMHEYYKRADYAKEAYSTIKYKDGAKTARGRIAILKGNPDNIESVVNKDQILEVWTYSRLNEKYVFEIKSPGEYVLTDILPAQ